MSGGQIVLLRSERLHEDLNACFQNCSWSTLVVILPEWLAVEASTICACDYSLEMELRCE